MPLLRGQNTPKMPLLRDLSSIAAFCRYIGSKRCQAILMPLNRTFRYSGHRCIGPPTVYQSTKCVVCICFTNQFVFFFAPLGADIFLGITRTRDLREFCTTSIPVHRTCVGAVRHSNPSPTLMYGMHARAAMPGVRVCPFETPGYGCGYNIRAYPELL